MPSRVQVDRHVVVYDANFRRREGERQFYGVIKDNHGAAKLLDASDRAWLGKPQPPPARAMWRSLFLAAAKVEVVNVWLCERACGVILRLGRAPLLWRGEVALICANK